MWFRAVAGFSDRMGVLLHCFITLPVGDEAHTIQREVCNVAGKNTYSITGIEVFGFLTKLMYPYYYLYIGIGNVHLYLNNTSFLYFSRRPGVANKLIIIKNTLLDWKTGKVCAFLQDSLNLCFCFFFF